VRKPSDFLRPALGWGVPAGQPVPALAEYYQGGLHVDAEPGTKWAYSNNGFATLGQIVEDVSGLPLDQYLRERVFGPLGMDSSDLVRSERVRARLATGYEIRSRGATAVRDLEMVQAGGGAAYSTMDDMARYVAALLGGGANSCGAALNPQTLAEMFRAQYQPDPRIPGMGLGFFRSQAGGYRTVGHDGIWLGFHSAVTLVPDEGIGVVTMTNTGPFSPFAATGPVAGAVLRSLLGLPEDIPATDVPERPWHWDELCGSYSFGPGFLTDPQPRMLGPALEVVARRDHLVVRGQLPVPAIRKGLRLYPDADDPDVFRVILPGFGSGTSPVVFGRDTAGDVTGMHLGMQPMSFRKRPRRQSPTR
jgi:CubicO group peptidase (beta-lactamase class C family)